MLTGQRFTSQERDWDTVPNLDYFYAGYYSGEQGRFLARTRATPEPICTIYMVENT